MNEMSKRALRIILGDRPIAYHPIFAKAMGSAAGGVWLSQITYWDSIKFMMCEKDGVEYDGWFFKTNAEIIGETCLSDRENREAKKRAQELGIVETEKRGAPPTTWYRLNIDNLEELLNGTPLPIQAVRRLPIQTVQIHAQILPQSTTESTTESKTGDSKTESLTPEEKEPAASEVKQPCGHPVSAIIGADEGTQYCSACVAAEAAAREFDAMPSAGVGMTPQEHTAGMADPKVEARELVKTYAPIFAQIVGREETIGEDRQAVRKMLESKTLRTRLSDVDKRLEAYRNGEGADFRKPDATAFWIVNRLERDLARVCVPRQSWDDIPRFHAED